MFISGGQMQPQLGMWKRRTGLRQMHPQKAYDRPCKQVRTLPLDCSISDDDVVVVGGGSTLTTVTSSWPCFKETVGRSSESEDDEYPNFLIRRTYTQPAPASFLTALAVKANPGLWFGTDACLPLTLMNSKSSGLQNLRSWSEHVWITSLRSL